MRKEKSDLEQLLNSLIEKGWKPFGALGKAKNGVYTNKYLFFEGCADGVTLRQLVSKESGLWQFVCENGMVDGVDRWTLNARQKSIYDKYITSEKEYTPKMNYEYRLIECSLKDENELEDFLLQNIKVGNED